MKNILFIFGTRPEIIKMSPVIHRFQADVVNYRVKICVTAQHRNLLDQMLNWFHINADYDLDLMHANQSLFDITTGSLKHLEPVLKETKPDLVFVQGDTTTAMTASLAAYYMRIPVAHIEAGLRTNNIYFPFPEEVNRQIVSRIAKFNFSPTKNACQNLIVEGIKEDSIHVVGNTVIDALYWTTNKLDRGDLGDMMTDECRNLENIILVTAHRRENFGAGIENICQSIIELSRQFPEVSFVYPVHPNPNVIEPVHKLLSNRKNIFLLKPLYYPQFVALMRRSKLLLTDSGGLQEEAPALGKPVLVLRDVSERPEAVDAGSAVLVGVNKDKIISETTRLLTDKTAYQAMAGAKSPYGDGTSSEQIYKIICDQFI